MIQVGPRRALPTDWAACPGIDNLGIEKHNTAAPAPASKNRKKCADWRKIADLD